VYSTLTMITPQSRSTAWRLSTFALILIGGASLGCEDTPSTSDSALLVDAMTSIDMNSTSMELDRGVMSCAEEVTEERCDGADNDCDGQIDEDFPSLGMRCEVRVRSCVSAGQFSCDPQGMTECNAPEIIEGDEICDERDNDCDGQTDEGYNLLIDRENCGVCGVECAWPNATGRCDAGVCVLSACSVGWEDGNDDLSDGCECNRDAEELCDTIDNDCDGLIDENFAVGQLCRSGEGECIVSGVFACVSPDEASCDARPGSPVEESCDGLDNDCDGVSDEDFDEDMDGSPYCDLCEECGDACPEHCFNNDCQPTIMSVHPLAWDVCEDTTDQNCDGVDAPCSTAYARVIDMNILTRNDTIGTCPDQNNDQIGDNAFSIISGIANPSIDQYISTHEMNLLLGAYGFDETQPELRFNLAVLISNWVRNTERFAPKESNYDMNGRPLMRFPFTQISADGLLEGGPGTFLFNAPINDQIIEVPVENAYIRGQFTLAPSRDRFSLTTGLVSGRIDKQALYDSLVLLDPEIVQAIESLIQADIDLDGDGEGDGYSICLTIELEGVEVYFPPTPNPEPDP
jgi:hypothetical protein